MDECPEYLNTFEKIYSHYAYQGLWASHETRGGVTTTSGCAHGIRPAVEVLSPVRRVPGHEGREHMCSRAEVGTDAFFKPLSLLPLVWFIGTSAATTATFSKSRNRFRNSATSLPQVRNSAAHEVSKRPPKTVFRCFFFKAHLLKHSLYVPT